MKTLLERLLIKTNVDSITGCLIWKASKSSGGYGAIKVNGNRLRAHRVAWELAKGPIPEGLCVLHRCDTPACVNVNHLFLGTHADNMRDRNSKGRASAGELHGSAKLGEKDIKKIRKDSRSQREIAKDYDVDHKSIWAIKNYCTWKHV